MIDKLVLHVPFKEQFYVYDEEREQGFLDVACLKETGIGLASKDVRFENGEFVAGDLYHPFESLPSSFGSLAVKVYHRPVKQVPHVALKCSPAKLMQGHNIYGSEDPLLGGGEMMATLAGAYPELADMLDFHLTDLSEIDTTYSSRGPTQEHCDQFVLACGNVSNGQTKKRQGYATTAYFGAKNTRLKGNKIYAKRHEVKNYISDLRRDNRDGCNDHLIAINEGMLDYSRGLIRFEATIHKRWLKRNGIPTGFLRFCKYAQDFEKEQGYPLTRWLFKRTFKDIFAAFEGVNMNVYEDEKLLAQLKNDHVSITPSGKTSYNAALSAFRTYRAIRSDGWETVLSSMSKSTFYRHIGLLSKSGISRAWLQNMHAASQNNVVPMVNLIKVDFESQRPADYVEPISQFDERFKDPRRSHLRLVA